MRNRQNYPEDWEEISKAIRFGRAKGFCEQCQAQHNSIVWNGQKFIKVVLTTAHVGIDKPDGTPGSKSDLHDVRQDNLLALCQRCHLVFDVEQHRQTNLRKKREYLEQYAHQQTFNFED